MKTFRFTGSPALYIECDVRMCHGRCPVSPPLALVASTALIQTFQSQPCHWRNVKNVRKRSIEGGNSTANATAPLSENVNLFQSLRVLQEGETDQEANVTYTGTNLTRLVSRWSDFDVSIPEARTTDANSFCLKTGWFAALLALTCGTLCLLGGALLATCSRMRKGVSDKSLSNSQFSGYMNHRATFK